MRRWLATADFETRSKANLKKVGAWRYSRDPSTQALCLGYVLDSGPIKLWHPGSPAPADLFAAIEDGVIFEAHNSFFEWCIWHNVMVKRHGWPALDRNRIICSAARAAVMCYPRALEHAVVHAGLDIRKGNSKAMKKLSRPRKPTKRDPREWIEPADDPALYQELYDYCKIDVEAEHLLSDRLPALSAFERRVFRADMNINLRGIRVDIEFVNAALKVAQILEKQIGLELCSLTGGDVMAATERDRIVDYLAATGLQIESLDKETVEDLLFHATLTKKQRRILELRQEGNKSSVTKYQSFLACADPDDDAVRGLYVYYGANAHGRFAARLVQPHNFPRGNAKSDVKDEKPSQTIERMVDAVKHAAKTRSPDYLRKQFIIKQAITPGDPKSGTKKLPAPPAEVLSTALRGAFIARPGKHFGVGDYSAIEARGLFWLADEEYGLSVYQNNGDIYRDMGSVIFNKPPEELDVDFERMLGKTTVLGCGYEMSWRKFQLTCKRAYGMILSDQLCKRSVEAYRERYPAVPEFWYDLDREAKWCIRTGFDTNVRLIKFSMRRGDLVITLPSGREIYHRKAKLARQHGRYKNSKQIVFTNGKGYIEGTYGGKICEYVTSGTARDILADAIVRAEFDYPEVEPVMHSHDELVCEGEPGVVGKIVSKIMGEMPAWSKGLPMKIEVWEGPRYRK